MTRVQAEKLPEESPEEAPEEAETTETAPDGEPSDRQDGETPEQAG